MFVAVKIKGDGCGGICRWLGDCPSVIALPRPRILGMLGSAKR